MEIDRFQINPLPFPQASLYKKYSSDNFSEIDSGKIPNEFDINKKIIPHIKMLVKITHV